MIGTLFIKQAAFQVFIGCKPEEHQHKQLLLVSIDMDVDVSSASMSDDIDDTVCYAKIHKQIQELMESKKFHIVEHVAEKVLDICFSYHQVLQAKVQIDKPDALDKVQSVGIKMQRKRA
jgi:FolB domain-containing protein